MKTNRTQAGFSIVEALIIIVIVGAISFVGYSVYDRANANRAKVPAQASQKAQEATTKEIPAAPAIEKTSDLDRASDALDQVDIEDSGEQSQLDGQIDQL